MSAESAFSSLIGRTPTEAERERLRLIKDQLGLTESDAVWSIFVALEWHRTLLGSIPAQIAESAQAVLQTIRAAAAEQLRAEASTVRQELARQVAETSRRLAEQLSGRRIRISVVTSCLAAVVAYGAVCAWAGYELASRPTLPFWVRSSPSHPVWAAVLGLPSGWLIALLLAPTFAAVARWGWSLSRDHDATRHERWLGTGILAASAGVALLALVAVRVLLS